MTERFQSQTEFDDAFTAVPLLATPVNPEKLNPGENNQTNFATLDSSVEIASESGTKIYPGKKITGTGEPGLEKKRKNTALSDFSIDTDCDHFEINKSGESNFCDTIIDTDEVFSDGEPEVIKSPIIAEAGQKIEVDEFCLQHELSGFTLKIQPDNSVLIPTGAEPVQLGSGVIAELLGTGGMAKVYKTWNASNETFRAVKLLLPAGDNNNLERFNTESKISANLKHPNIIRVYETGEWHGLPYMEMEYVEGVTLQVFLKFFKSLPPQLCSAVMVQIARALSYAHTQQIVLYGKKYKGIIHRDLKPSNIMIGFNGSVKLMDFGVARPIETGLHTANIESIVGTLQYFPPEQINGYPIDQLADIYSFGAVLYEMLCGINPFPQLNLAELIRAKTINKYTRLHEFHLDIEPHLSSLAQTCLRTEKHRRIQNSVLLRDYLEDLHYSLGMNSPERVIQSFFNSTETSSRK